VVTQDAGSSLVRGVPGPSDTQHGTSPIGSTTISDGGFEPDRGDGIFLGLAFDTIGVNTDLTSGYIGNSGSGIVGIAVARSPINA
jgi:hypothetical protein